MNGFIIRTEPVVSAVRGSPGGRERGGGETPPPVLIRMEEEKEGGGRRENLAGGGHQLLEGGTVDHTPVNLELSERIVNL
jgi:hypothetical protein